MKKLVLYISVLLSAIACSKSVIVPTPTMSITDKPIRLIPADTSVQVIFTMEVSIVATGGRIFFADSSLADTFFKVVCSTPNVTPIYHFEIKPMSGLDSYANGIRGIKKDVIATFNVVVSVFPRAPGDYNIKTETFPYSGNGNDGQYESRIISRFESSKIPI